jgi:hypothetical protein
LREQDIRAKLEEICNSIKGLSIEVEMWRVHTSGNGGFFLKALKDLLVAVNQLKEAVK